MEPARERTRQVSHMAGKWRAALVNQGSFFNALIRPRSSGAGWLAHAAIDIWLFVYAWTGPRDPPRAPCSEIF